MNRTILYLTTWAVCAVMVVLVVASPLFAQNSQQPYPNMAPLERYLMPDRNAEIALARSAAPAAISDHATLLVLGHQGYATAVKGDNGFVCLVERSWMGGIDSPELWNPNVRGPDCLNPPAVRSILPILRRETALALAGDSRQKFAAGLKAAFEQKELPALEPGAMSYMMSKNAYLTDADGHNLSHVMFYTTLPNGALWGANLPGSPVATSPFLFTAKEHDPLSVGFPPIRLFIVAVVKWSDGTPALAASSPQK